ncbi:hypothetical protein A3D80_01410 [Candidatus Roizmanbacteria bacterium RIFCSPHIGHO2_02_FULL_40_13b]|uniref:BioF2-like acetyltransferase domain-containing protein n=1 Tax=Candidatus Roizmanbacteria bacterium RIFCSPHIGHO2_01_FULL_39_24 TaxID=1802032 RepID=A0A1F7GFJ4_9BACT|nr:MAG: hypothetical protein A2799_03415 [Candidatus Roizmanbacteria bacterium RIFCSPHIGHO2_01_FULL_39_24]OGK26225.1 MAG: hypothetical protein A3D80_01410 [Candidatus Roizmanbacteria bacterium RIFCSPHIGHO2_02_FULL_40_13b]OGK50377.1 MAG: hypothetical protein A3A56_00350 [Candidatus Roizmanbacteria bacterium RIFCSPLOWO2_01_FULL_40_32]OGK56220.1 MAG: hypothetical protein A3H83_01745 [Candidatus Roizmanbacteria bacterium RIFCSPLOWO2_02_FULL_39_8]
MVETKQIIDKNEWDLFLSTHGEANFLQSWEWGEFHEQLHHTIERTGFSIDGKLEGVMLSIVEPARRGRYLTVPGGPIIEWENEELINEVSQAMKEIGKRQRCVFVRVRPQLLNTEKSWAIFKAMGFVLSPMHLHAQFTLQLDLSKSEEELLSEMRKNTRYEVRKAMNEGIRVEKSTDENSIRAFYDLQLQTAKRHGFVPFSYPYLHEQFKVFAAQNMAYLYSAYHNDELLAKAYVIFYGNEAVYHFGASTPQGREHPGAYLLQWEAIKEAKMRGMKHYNFWGIVHEHEKNHRFYGVSVFKRGFGGEEVEYLPAQDLIINKPRYLLTTTFEHLRKRMRKV